MKRTLRLRREALADLTSGDLAAVEGGAPDASGPGGITCPIFGCLGPVDPSRLLTCAGCVTGPLGC